MLEIQNIQKIATSDFVEWIRDTLEVQRELEKKQLELESETK